MRPHSRSLRWIALLVLLPLAAGCMAAVGAAAGAAGAIAYNERNASADVPASVDALTRATRAVFQEMGIAIRHEESSEGGTEMEVHGRTGETDVVVKIENEGGATTQVVVTAREGTVDYKPTYAGQVLERIIQRAR